MCNLNPISRTQYDREDHPRNQERFLHPSDGGRQRGVLPCERDGGPLTHGFGVGTELHAESGSGQTQDGSSGCNPLHILNTLGKGELEPLVTEQAAEAEQNLADVRAAFPVPVFGQCGHRLEEPRKGHWIHANAREGLFCPNFGTAKPFPPVVISSPAYFLPELKSDADHFAENYRLEHDLPFSMLQHLAWAWLMGQQDERLKGGK